MIRKKTVLFMALFSLSGCASPPKITPTQDISSIDTLTLTARYLDADIPPSDRQGELKKIILTMPLIPGALTGSVSTPPIIIENAYIGKSFTINLSKYREIIAKYAKPLLDKKANLGLTITPKSTKLARIGTFARNPHTGRFLGPTGLQDLKASHQIQLFLIYFDGPAIITGTTHENGTKITYHVKAKEQGFVWLEVDRADENSLIVTNRRSKRNPTLIIQAPLNKSSGWSRSVHFP